jgi:hypothetical protein
MALAPQDAARFGRSSPVLRHWLANSEGFRVRSRRGRGVVLRVHGLPGLPQTIVVRTSLGARRVLVPADAFDEVVPEERLLRLGTSLRRAARGERERRSKVARASRRLMTTCHKVVVERGSRLVERGAVTAGRASRGLATTCHKAVFGRGMPLAKRGVLVAALSIGRVARAAAIRGSLYGARGLRAGGRLLWGLVLTIVGMLRDAGMTLAELARVSWPRLWGGLARAANYACVTAIFVARRASSAGFRLAAHARDALRRHSGEREEPPLLPGRARE